MSRWAAGVEYDGSAFCGWQTQEHGDSVQAALERALARVADAPVSVHAAGRTDAGVHALGQVIHFDAEARRSARAWHLGVNAHLPPSVSLRWVCEVPDDFHARHSAWSRRYRYRIDNAPSRPALDAQRVYWVRRPIDAAAMHEAGRLLTGEQDFSAFRAAQCQSGTPMRFVSEVLVNRIGDEVRVEIEANAFVHHMVRNIVGSLLRVGCGEASRQWLAEVLAGRDRRAAGPTAPAQGLYLLGVRYPPRYSLPATTLPPMPALGIWAGASAR